MQPPLHSNSSGASDQPVQLQLAVKDGAREIGYLVIDTLVHGRSHGGVRMRPDVTAEEIGLLARTMTLKYGFLGLPFGGAKAGVVGDPEAPLEERRMRMARFGGAIAELLRKELFVPAADMGTQLEDIRHLLREAGVRLEKRRLPAVSSGWFTAHSVFAGLREMARSRGLDLAGLTVAVEGFGAVGSALAGLLAQAGACVVAISTSEGGAYDPEGLDIPALQHQRVQHGSRLVSMVPDRHRVPAGELIGLPVDALCPCAGIHAIHERNAGAVRARLICPGANNPWTDSAASLLHAEGALMLPDYAANTGGILGTLMAYLCFPTGGIERFVLEQFARSTRWLLREAEVRGMTLRQAGDELISFRRKPPGSEGRRGWVPTVGLAMHRRGLIPGPLVRPFAAAYLRRSLRLPSAR